MAYLIPKSARNVRVQLFKGLGLPEVVIIAISFLIAFVVFNVFGENYLPMIIIITVLGLFTVFLVSPSFLVNKKGYQFFRVIFDYYYQQKDYKRRKKVKKNVEKSK